MEDLVYDFHQMFANIFKYYSELHPAFRKAHDLSDLFETRLAAATLLLR